MKPRFGMVSNPLSHTVSRRGSMLERAANREPDVLYHRLDVFDELPGVLRRFAAEGIEAIFIEGGDGTAMAVLTEILSGRSGLSVDIPIGLLPGGMTNLAAKVLGVRNVGQGGIRALLEDLRQGNLTGRAEPMPLLEVSLSKTGQPLYGFFLSTGAIPNGIRYCRRALHSRGAQGSFAVGLTLVRLIFGPRNREGNEVMRPTDLALESPVLHAAGSHLFTLATTLPRLSLGLDPFWGDGRAAVRFTHAAWPEHGLIRALFGILAGGPKGFMRKRGMESFNTDEVLIKHSGEMVLDGEFLAVPPSGKVRISATRPMVFVR